MIWLEILELNPLMLYIYKFSSRVMVGISPSERITAVSLS